FNKDIEMEWATSGGKRNKMPRISRYMERRYNQRSFLTLIIICSTTDQFPCGRTIQYISYL
ncbi:MAG: hypothetical protein ACM3VS_08540, partial [Candidatus Dadabacteria bacterium]